MTRRARIRVGGSAGVAASLAAIEPEPEEAVLTRLRNALAFLVERTMREMVRDAREYRVESAADGPVRRARGGGNRGAAARTHGHRRPGFAINQGRAGGLGLRRALLPAARKGKHDRDTIRRAERPDGSGRALGPGANGLDRKGGREEVRGVGRSRAMGCRAVEADCRRDSALEPSTARNDAGCGSQLSPR